MSARTAFACIAIVLAVAFALAPTPTPTPTPASAITAITLSPNTTTPAPRSPLVVTARVDTSPAGLRASYRWQRKAGARWVDITRLPWLSITYFSADARPPPGPVSGQ